MRRTSKRKNTEQLIANFGAGKSMEEPVRRRMESSFNYDFSKVRIFHEERHGQMAEELSADAFTLDKSIVFGPGKYQPDQPGGNQLLAHELSHVIQQQKDGQSPDAEGEARQTAANFSVGRAIDANALTGAPASIQKQEKKEKETPEKKPEPGPREVKVDVKQDELLQPEKKDKKKDPAPGKLPSRLPVPGLSYGNFSVGLRLGFPELESGDSSRFGPDPLKESLQRAKLMDQVLTGKVPSGWESTDKGKLAEAAWGIFSTYIAPDLAAKLTDGLSVTTSPGGMTYELDAVLITDFSKEIGGGLSFTLKW